MKNVFYKTAIQIHEKMCGSFDENFKKFRRMSKEVM